MRSFAATAIVTVTLLCCLPLAGYSQRPSPTPTPKKHIEPHATMKGVGTEKVIKGTKNAGRHTESGVGKGAGKAKRYLSQKSRAARKQIEGSHPKPTPTPHSKQ